MLGSTASRVPIRGKQRMTELACKSQSLGLTPERYVQKLIEQDLALDRQARNTTFAQLMGSGSR